MDQENISDHGREFENKTSERCQNEKGGMNA